MSVASQTVRQRHTHTLSLPAEHQTVWRRRRAEKQRTHEDSFMSGREKKSSAWLTSFFHSTYFPTTVSPKLLYFCLHTWHFDHISLSYSQLYTFVPKKVPDYIFLYLRFEESTIMFCDLQFWRKLYRWGKQPVKVVPHESKEFVC